MSEVELFPGHVSPLGLGTIPHADSQSTPGSICCSGSLRAITRRRRLPAAQLHTDRSGSRAGSVSRPAGRTHLNPLGGVHGGWAATIIILALGCAVQTTLAIGEAYTTAEFKVNLIRPITPRTGEVVCEGRVVHRGRTLAVSEATLKDDSGKLLAFGTETCSIFPVANLAGR